jgi:hypothetical protein
VSSSKMRSASTSKLRRTNTVGSQASSPVGLGGPASTDDLPKELLIQTAIVRTDHSEGRREGREALRVVWSAPRQCQAEPQKQGARTGRVGREERRRVPQAG